MQGSVACGVSSPAEQARQHVAESGDRSSARPKKEFRRKQASEARFSRRGNRQRMRRQTRQRLRSKTRLPERNLRVTLPAWLEGRRSQESGNFVHESRAGTKEPKEERELERKPGRRCGSRPRAETSVNGFGRRRRSPREDGRSAESLAVSAVEDRRRGNTSAAWPMMRDPKKIRDGTEGLAGRRKRTRQLKIHRPVMPDSA